MPDTLELRLLGTPNLKLNGNPLAKLTISKAHGLL